MAIKEPAYIHATALVIGETGLLLRGPSGAGKSGLALSLIIHARARGDFARIVADDRVSIEARNGRLVARPHAAIAGMIEARGQGLLTVAHEPACALHAIVDIAGDADSPARYPEESEKFVDLHGALLPRLAIRGSDALAPSRILLFIQQDTTI